MATSPDESIVGWLGDDGAPRVVEGGGSRTWDLPVVENGVEIAAVLGAGTCKEGVDGNGCAIFVNAADGSGAFVSASHGVVDGAGTASHIADASSDGRVTGLVATPDHGSCSGLWTSSGRLGWKTCDLTLGAFSPDETRILAGGARTDRSGQSALAFLVTPVASWRTSGQAATPASSRQPGRTTTTPSRWSVTGSGGRSSGWVSTAVWSTPWRPAQAGRATNRSSCRRGDPRALG